MALRHLLIAVLVGLTAGLVPLAQASPPDQTWLGGLYDDADYDDVVVGVTSAVSAVESEIVREPARFEIAAEHRIRFDQTVPPVPERSPNLSRAPPSA